MMEAEIVGGVSDQRIIKDGVAGKAEDVSVTAVLRRLHDLGAAIIAVAAPSYAGVRPVLANALVAS
jgi:hypothetical protein